MFIAAPSILSADFSKLLEEVKDVSSAKFLHIDVMDGHFVPNITIGPLVVKSLKGKVDMVFDCHLMISDPKKYTEAFAKAGADIITFHFEALNNKEETKEEESKGIIEIIVDFFISIFRKIKEFVDSIINNIL